MSACNPHLKRIEASTPTICILMAPLSVLQVLMDRVWSSPHNQHYSSSINHNINFVHVISFFRSLFWLAQLFHLHEPVWTRIPKRRNARCIHSPGSITHQCRGHFTMASPSELSSKVQFVSSICEAACTKTGSNETSEVRYGVLDCLVAE